MTVTCIVQARMGSTRLPGKVLMDLGGRPMLAFLLERLSRLDVDALVVATSDLPGDDPVAEVASAAGAKVVRGPAMDVLARYDLALEEHPADVAVRITADCPLTDPEIVGAALERHAETQADYTSNTLIRMAPDGLDVEVVQASALHTAARESVDEAEREHVTPFIYRRPERFRLAALRSDENLGGERWTIDTSEDLEFVRGVVSALGGRSDFGWREVLLVAGSRGQSPPGELALRPVSETDVEFLLALRNDPDAVRWSRTSRAVEPAEHQAWFRSRLADPGRRIWIGEVDAKRVGQVRVEVRGGTGEVSIGVDNSLRGRGYGLALLRVLQRTLLIDRQVVALLATIHRDNEASARTFRNAGFELEADRGPFLLFRWRRSTLG